MIALNTVARYDALYEQLTRNLPLFAPPEPPAMGVPPGDDLLSAEAMPPDPRQMAIVAVIDHCIPFAHRLLTTQSGHSRVASIWMQDGPPPMVARPDIPFGQELRGPEIDQLRGAGSATLCPDEALYRGLGLMDAARAQSRWMLRARSHGAGIACTAAGYPPDDPTGRAHPLIAVGLPDWALADTSGAAMPLLMQVAVVFIISRARLLARQINRSLAGPPVRPPLVVNISLGITAGSRDGQSLIELMQQHLADDPPPELGPVHFVLASGNTRQRRLNGVLAPGQGLGWQLLPDDRTLSEMQLWTPPAAIGAPAIRLRLELPGLDAVETAFAAPGGAGAQIAKLVDPQGRELARLVLQAVERDTGLRQCLTLIAPPTVADAAGQALAPPGLWQITLLQAPGACDVTVQRDDRLFGFPRAGRQSRLADPAYHDRDASGRWQSRDPQPPNAVIRRDGTLNAYAWGPQQIRCGAHYAGRGGAITSYASLLGDGACGDLTAPGDRSALLAGMPAPALRGAGLQFVSGTSIATARVARWLSQRMAGPNPPRTRAQAVDLARGQGGPRLDPPMPWDRR
ncbi:hypothetical protein [Paracoccus shanxieyensis]|uniref:Uncharacterized protein n=1 Tax=Paracoccus shanxieyensis TaxID=2675752 RepID=A0A6L6IVZ3_9RHOB|nr:hypothetical protein [Paracoccus shanxieyensis]MTH63811.1 hypothetical protein [Paracoccus shanxieyensis]MTH86678.1 hypothetical protein [Paracoccus shanxieyensis]